MRGTDHHKVAMATFSNGLKALTAMQADLEKAGCAEWIRRFIAVEVRHLRSLQNSADSSIRQHKIDRMNHYEENTDAALADTTTADTGP